MHTIPSVIQCHNHVEHCGTISENMVEIKSPTNFGLNFGRVLVNGPDDGPYTATITSIT
jgi:hypothetical protein